MSHRQRGTLLLRALTVAYALPMQTCEFSLHILLLAMVAAVTFYVKLRFAKYSTGQLNYSRPVQRRSYEGAFTPFQHFAVNISFHKSFTKNSAYYSNLATSWQSLRPHSGSTLASYGSICGSNYREAQCARNGKKQSQLPSLSLHTSWRQPMLTLFIHSHIRSLPSRHGCLVCVSPCLLLV